MASPNRPERLPPPAEHHTVMIAAAEMSRMALMICTPGRALHPADEDIGDHDGADDGDDEVLRGVARDTEGSADEGAGASHLARR